MSSRSDSVTSTGAALRLDGSDALDVLHRISTQFLSDLGPGAGRATLFCDFRGRLLHRVWVARDAAGAVWLLRPDAAAAELAAFIARHVFREDVRTEDRTGAGDAPALPEVERFASELERIRHGHPRHGHEISDEFTPFEINRDHEVHLSKGCFTGQEALMRLVTYRSVRRRLVRVEGVGAAPAVPAAIMAESGRVGRLTSATELEPSANAPRWIGLAVMSLAVHRDAKLHLEDGTPIESVEPFPITAPVGLP